MSKTITDQLFDRREKVVSNGVGVFVKSTIKSAENGTVLNYDGESFIDFGGGIGVLNAGHCPPPVVEAIKAQAEKLIHSCFHISLYEPYVELCEKLVDLFPHGEETKAMLTNTGAEAVENAIKIARQATKRQAVLCFTDAFHGRSMMAMTLTSKIDYKKNCGPFAPEVYRLPFPNFYRYGGELNEQEFAEQELNRLYASAKNMVDPANIAAVIIEVVQGEGGFNPAPKKYIQGLREFCDEQGIVLIFDEVQSGFCRTGKWAAYQHYDVLPDLSTWAKSMGSGMPIGAVVGKKGIMDAAVPGTIGGLDSLLQPTGPLKEAQEMASKAFGSEHTYFVTNGTSASNKIVVQALIEPEDLVLVDRDCHKSHHYGMVLAGAYPVYLDSYSLERYSMYGGVSTKTIVDKLLVLKKAGLLHKVRMLLLTNCTFDGLVYNVEKVMEAVLAIKPDIVFLWDEAWFGFAGFTYNYKQRTAMYNAAKLRKKFHSQEYKEKYAALKAKKDPTLATMPDPDLVKVRVYSTQSTHKTLSSFRQGSMIHIHDEEFKRKSEDAFHEAYMTHISTSPNYQILASLDAGRRQVQFEGFELV